MESEDSKRQSAVVWVEIMSLAGPMLTLSLTILLSIFLGMSLWVKFSNWRDAVKQEKVPNSESALHTIQVRLTQMNQDIKLIQNVLVSMIPLLGHQESWGSLVREKERFRGCHYCGEESHYIKACPYLPGVEEA